MQRRENYLYVGMDLHKDTHTAVLVNCWNEKLDVMVIKNKPSEFGKLAKRVNKKATALQERLKDLRVERGLALEQLEEQVNLSKSALGSYEARASRTSATTPLLSWQSFTV
jgi:hypothetical protein